MNNGWRELLQTETPEVVYTARRRYLKWLGIATASWSLSACAESDNAVDITDGAHASVDTDPFTAEDPMTRFEDATSYNNFYEFGTGKSDPRRYAGQLRTTPWEIEVSGLVEQPTTLSLTELLPIDERVERIYRLRCVEAWSMVIRGSAFHWQTSLHVADRPRKPDSWPLNRLPTRIKCRAYEAPRWTGPIPKRYVWMRRRTL